MAARSGAAFFSTTLMRMSTLSVVIATWFGHVTVVRAQMVAYKNGVSQPVIDQAGNGRTLVQIIAPNSSGLSHNKYEQFNVDKNGVILNNSASTALTQLGGYVEGNPNLAAKRSAGIILNEVMGTNRSQLNGYIEVAGQRADVIVANPNGISVGGGAGFINAARGVLTTGTPILGGDGSLSGFRVSKGDISIDAGGLNGTGVEQLDLIARSVVVNDNLWANKLNIVTGSNQVNFAHLSVQAIAAEGKQPAVGIDSAALGGMYAQKIMLVGTEAGVGVRALGNIAASAGDITIDHHGKIILNGSTNASGKISLRSDDDISNAGTLYAQQRVALNSAGQVTNTGTLAALSDLSVQSKSLNSSGILAAGIDGSGQALHPGSLNLSASGFITATGQNTAGARIDVTGSAINMANATTIAGDNIFLTATSGDINHSHATLQSAASFTAMATGAINNNAGVIHAGPGLFNVLAANVDNTAGSMRSNGQLNVQAASVNNQRGQIIANQDASLLLSGDLMNQEGNLQAAYALTVQAHNVDNSAGRILSLNSDGLTLHASGQISNAAGMTIALEQGGLIGGNGDVNLSAQQIINHASISAANKLNSTAQGQINNSGGVMTAGESLQINAASFMNEQGTLNAGAISVSVTTLDNNGGMIGADQLQLTGATISNQQGKIIQYGQGDSLIDISQSLDNSHHGLIQINSANLTVHARDLNNVDGTVAHAGSGLFTLSLSDILNNQTGSIGSNGTLQVSASVLKNQSGTLFGLDTTSITTTGDIENDLHGYIGGGQLSLTTTENISNSLGKIEATHSGLQINATNLNNAAGVVQNLGTGTLNISLTQSLTNTRQNSVAGFIGNLGDININANAINNANSTIYSQKNLQLRANDAFSNAAGIIQSDGALTLFSGNDFNNQAGRIEANGMTNGASLELSAGSINNTEGRIASSGAGSASINGRIGITNTAGMIGGNGQLNLTSDLFTNRQGQLIATGDMNLFISHLLNNAQGSVFSGKNLTLQQTQTSVDNTQGVISSSGNVVFAVKDMNNTQGQINHSNLAGSYANITVTASGGINNAAGSMVSNNDLAMQANTIIGEGAVLAGNSTIISLQGDYTNSAASLFSANNILQFSVTGNLVNNGIFSAKNGLILRANNISNAYGALMNSYQTVLYAQNNLTNQGRIYGDFISLGAGSLLNDQNAVIAARANLQLGAQSITNQNHGFITSLGDIAIGGAIDSQGRAFGKANVVTNSQATMDSGGDFIVTAGTLNNLNPTFAVETVVTDTRQMVEYAYNADMVWMNGTLTHCGGDTQGLPCISNNGRYWILNTSDHRSSNDYWQRIYTQTTLQDRVIATDPGQIYANGNIFTNVDQVYNYASAIVAGLGISGSGVYLYNQTPQGQTTYVNYGSAKGACTDCPGLIHHNTANKKDNWPVAVTIDERISGPAINFSIWPGDSEPGRLNNPAQGVTAGANQLSNGTASQIGKNGAGSIMSGTEQAISSASGSAGNVALVTSNTQTVSLPGIAIPNLTLPGNQLFIIHTQPGKTYLVETDPAFTNYANFISSDYLLSRLSINSQATQLRLGDGYYEQKLINDQLMQLTGRRLLNEYSNAEEQYKALMTAGVYVAEQMKLAVGIALSAEQMAALTSDIVWLVSQNIVLPDGSHSNVLVPVVYLAQLNAGDVRPGGAIISASDINLAYSGSMQNSGTLLANKNMIVNASSITNSGALMASSTQGQMILAAQHDMTSNGTISANRIGILAGDNIHIASTTQTQMRPTSINTDITQLASINADQLSMQAGKDINLSAAQINTSGNAVLQAGNNLNLNTVNIASSSNYNFGSAGHYNTSQSQDVGTQIQSKGNLTLAAGQDINTKAAYASADGQLNFFAGHDINLGTGTQQNSFDMESHSTSKGFFSSRSTTIRNQSNATQSIASTISGDSVQIVAGRDINVTGSNIVGTNDMAMMAGNNIAITSSQDTASQSYYQQERKSGFFSGGGIGITYGNQSQADTNQQTSITHQGSLIGSLSGNVMLQAGNNIDIAGSAIVAQQDVTLLGRNITISQVQNDLTQSEQYEFKQSGMTLSLGSPTVNVATGMAQNIQRASEVDDPRLKKLYAAQVGMSGLANSDNTYAEVKQISKGNTGSISVNLSAGSSKSESQSTSHVSQAQGSQIQAGGNLKLAAVGEPNNSGQGNISITGSQLSATNATLVASNDMLIQSAQNISDNQSTNNSSGWNAGIGMSLGEKTGFTYSANGYQAKANANGTSTEQSNSQISAGNQLILVSGRDTVLSGAQVNASQIYADIGRDLTITSLQDTQSYQNQQRNISGGFSYTAGTGTFSASMSANRSNTTADYASVNQQSGFYAGSGGYNINVGNHTQLNGGILGSSAPSNQNLLSTASLDYSDILNQKHYDSSANSISGGTGSIGFEAGKSVLSAWAGNANLNDSDTSLTKATISAGNVEIRSGDVGVLNAINRDTALANNSLQYDDIQHITQATQNSSEAGQVIANMVGQIVDVTHYAILDKQTKGDQVYLIVCKQEPCTYDPMIQIDPNRRDSEGNPNVQLVHITEDNIKSMTLEERQNIVVATNGILNNPQRAGELALQNADAIDARDAKSGDGNTKPKIVLVTSPYSGNFISEFLVAGYEKFLTGLFGYSNPDTTVADTLLNVGLNNATLLSHSRGTLVTNNALQILIDEGVHSDTLKVQLKGPALSKETITTTVNQLRTSDEFRQTNAPEYSSFPNDSISTFIGFSPNGQIIPSLREAPHISNSSNSAHSSYGTGAFGSVKIEKPYSYQGVDPLDLQKLRQNQVDAFLKMGILYNPDIIVNPVNGLLPTPLYFQANPIWGANAIPVTPILSTDERVNQLRDLQQQLPGKE